ncbi:MAG: MBL fold metallo-hydrolase, partial [Clostridia bacterium]|nr:MBL fold metallo-hydrolase [Clostridia bacterium]
MARISPLFSGSRGNCIAVGGSERFVLIDAGVSAKRIENALRERCYNISKLSGIFITHEHGDHISGVRVFASRYHIPVYATAGTLYAMREGGHLEGVCARECPAEGMESGGVFVKPFATMHDTIESCGYVVETPDHRRVAVATDMGCVTDSVRDAIRGCHLAYIESNHDIDMLASGAYPQYLKHRILSTRGHLSNDACAAELSWLAASGTARFILAHLSRENNLPELAYKASLAALTGCGMREGIDFTLQTA